ncbi:F-box protein SKIP23-like [Chenopodium quinoa]|uniref:F-box protein SKIP23-like n=1 Tax=Chenopodium quinoa TaxID=63459 RepID=UPI000B76E8AC|nr:F-box protein SKIP23-like [Chenopodium quinoa]
MADWSDLPRELLDEILTRLDSPIDALRFRAVCSTWRHSSPSNLKSNGPQTPLSLPSHGISLSKRSIFVLSPCETPISELPHNDNPNSWVIKIEEKNLNFFHIFFPLSWTQIDPLPEDFPRVMDLSNIRIRELGCEYFLRYTDKICFRGDFLNLLIEKVAIIPGINHDHFFLLTIHVSGKLALYNSVNNIWHIISDKIDVPYDDIIAFNGEFYAVDYTGRIVLVRCDAIDNTALLATSFGGGDKKRLVEVGDELMLVDVYMGLPPWEYDHDMENFDGYVTSRSKWFKVYRLDRKNAVD